MSVRSDIEKRILKLQSEINEFHGHAAEIFSEIEQREFAVLELQAVLKTLPKDSEGDTPPQEVALRKGSDMANARDVLRSVRVPLHVDDLLRQLGKPIDKKHRASLSGQMSVYVRKGQVFTKTAPNTFGLKELENKTREQIDRTVFLAEGPFEIRIKEADKVPGLPLPEDEPESSDQAH